ncbi:MAG: preprotein translocase subunit YajC [Fimbriimonadaceae bacterium]|nr:preprotein translocase subunit YajC [Alphaproteobacteria bacterium]
MFITPAFAQDAAGGMPGGLLLQMVPFLLIFVVIYFLILRPQQKRAKEHREMVSSLRRGDVIVTAGGLVGKVSKIIDDVEVQVELAEGVRVRLVRQMITDVRSRSEPVKDSAKS